MKFSCPKDKLLKAIQIVHRAVASKSTKPTLTGIYIEATENQLIFRATDLEISIQYQLALDIERPGKAILPARYLNDLVRRLPNIDITIEQQLPNQIFTFSYGNSETQLIGMEPDDFPQLPLIKNKQKLQIDASLFNNIIKQVSTASAIDNMRPIFAGIYLETNNQDRLVMVATDTHRLAYSSIKLPSDQNNQLPFSLVIPTKSLMETTRLLNDDDTLITMQIGTNQVLFKLGETTIVTRLIEGNFPSYKQVIPESHSTRIKANTKLLLEAVDRATLLAQDENKFRSNVLKITSRGKTLVLEARSQEVGQAYEEIPIYLEGEEIEINFNGRYLLDALRVIDAEEIYFDLTGNLSPGIFRPADGRDFIYLVLPVRTSI